MEFLEKIIMNKILITGGAGAIGCRLARHLLSTYDKNFRLVLVDNLQRGKLDEEFKEVLKDKRVQFLKLDLTNLAHYKKLGKNYNAVYHLAAVNGTKLFYAMPHETLRINCLSLIYMLEWFRKNSAKGKFCFTSSNEAYAGGLNAFGVLPIPTPEAVPLVIDDPYNARWSYASSKLVGELFVIHYAKMYNFRALIVRPHNFYGPRTGYDHVIPEFCQRIIARIEPFPIYGADDARTFCYMSDAVRAMQMLMDSNKTDDQPIETVHIGATEEIKMGELAEKLFKAANWHPKKIEIHEGPVGSVKRRLANITKLQNLTGWKNEVSLDEGLKKTFEWYLTHPKV